MNAQPGNWRSGITSAATAVLCAAVALYVAVRLIEAVAPALIAVGMAAVIAGAVIAIVRYRRSRW